MGIAAHRTGWVAATVLCTALLLPPAASAQQDEQAPETPAPNWFECVQGLAFPGPSGEIYGPTAINAQSANQRLATAVDDHGTVTVFRWPRPSFYDQVKYRTATRDAEHLGALPNEGAFLGLAVTTADGTETIWLRDLPSSMRHPDQRSDVIETVYTTAGSDHDGLGLEATVRDVVAHDADVLSRQVTVARAAESPVTAARLVAFENFNLVVSKYAYFPVQDWCFEEQNTDQAVYDEARDAVIHSKEGVDQSTGAEVSVAVGMAFDRPSTGHQVGGDAHEGSALPAGRVPGPTQDAYDDAADGTLSGGTQYAGQTTGALATDLDLADGEDTVTLYLAAAGTTGEVGEVLAGARGRDFDAVVAAKSAWFERLLADAPLPATEDESILALANRALVTLVSVYDQESGAIVASVATQSPYGEDWPRDGAFFDHALDLIGRHDWVRTRVKWYAQLQSGADPTGPNSGSDNPVELNPFVESSQAAFVPPGNWAMNYYADGVVGGPIPWEIDETGYTLWLFWDHYAATGDAETLRSVYPAIRRAADFLVQCRDPGSGLQCPAVEDDNPQPRQSIHGAGPVWLGLDSAVKAAAVLGETGDADRWRARREELRTAIEDSLYADGSYAEGNPVIVWPVCFHPFDHPRFADSHYEAVWDRLAPTFAEPAPGEPEAGLYESKGLVSLAKATKGRPEWTARVRRGLRWIATHHATPGTHIMGEEWFNQDGDVISTVSQPHVWEQILFYLAAIEAYPPAGLDGEDHRTCAGTIGALRGDLAPAAGGGADAASDAPEADDEGGDAGPGLPATGGGAAATGLLLLTAAALSRRERAS